MTTLASLQAFCASVTGDMQEAAQLLPTVKDPIERAALTHALLDVSRRIEKTLLQIRGDALREDQERGTCTIDEVASRTRIPRNIVAEARRKSPRPTTRRGRQA